MKTVKYYNRFETLNDKDELHSFDNKPAVEWFSGGKEWYKEGKLHRIDGHASEDSSGSEFWYKEDKRHRLDGPAIEYSSGEKYWYYEGKRIKCSSTEEFLRIINLKTFW